VAYGFIAGQSRSCQRTCAQPCRSPLGYLGLKPGLHFNASGQFGGMHAYNIHCKEMHGCQWHREGRSRNLVVVGVSCLWKRAPAEL
jgi:hypothetical protein